EDVLNTALSNATDAPDEWQTTARTLLVAALAAQGRMDEAVKALGRISGGTPADLLLMLEELTKASQRVDPKLREQLAKLELKTLSSLDAAQLNAQQRDAVDRIRARALADLGKPAEALVLLEKLAKQHPNDGQIQEDYATLLDDSTDPEQQRKA